MTDRLCVNSERKRWFSVVPIRYLVLTCMGLPMVALAQSDDSDMGIWTEVGVAKKINKKVTVGLEAEMRTYDNASETSRWAVGMYGDYRFAKWLKGSVGYDFLYDRRVKYTYHDDGSVNKYANFWTPRHRFHADLTGSIDMGRWNFSLRERWQYTYRPEKTVDERYDYDLEDYDGEAKTYSGTGKHVLRSRLQVAYNLNQLEPYANVELYNGWGLEKTRYTVGLDWDITKHHQLGAYYRFQTTNDDSDEESDMHIIGLSYKFKF